MISRETFRVLRRIRVSCVLLIFFIFINGAQISHATEDVVAQALARDLAPKVKIQPMQHEECIKDDVGIFELPKSKVQCPCTLIVRKNSGSEPPNGTLLVVRDSDYKAWKSSGSELEPFSIASIPMDSDGEWERRVDVTHSGEFLLVGHVPKGTQTDECLQLNYIFGKNEETACPLRLSVSHDSKAPNVKNSILYGSDDFDPEIQRFMVGVFTPGKGGCTGTVVGKNWVLTAAHCEPDVETTRLYVGGETFSAGYEFKVQEVYPHPKYISGMDSNGAITSAVQNDVALLRTSYEIKAGPIYVNKNSRIPFKRDIVRAAGYGLSFKMSERGALNVVDVSEIPHAECKEAYSKVIAGKTLRGLSKKEHICAGPDLVCGGGVCRGDSGGPILVKLDGAYVQVGVTSFGLDCSYKEYAPDVFSRLSYFSKWIEETTNGEVSPVDVMREPVGPSANDTAVQEAYRLRNNRRRRTIGFSIGSGVLLGLLVLGIIMWYLCMKHRNRTGSAGR